MPAPNREMRARVHSGDVERVGVGKLVGILVGGREHEHELAPRRHVDARGSPPARW